MLSLILMVSAPNPHLLTCSEYDWILEGVEKVDILTDKEKAEIKLEFIRATDPKCFES